MMKVRVLSDRLIVYEEGGGIFRVIKLPLVGDWMKFLPKIDVPIVGGRVAGEFMYADLLDGKRLVAGFSIFNGLDWNVWIDLADGSIFKITENR